MRLLAAYSICKHARAWRSVGLALALCVYWGPVLANDSPFDLETSSWMSFDRYKEKPTNWIAPDQRRQVMMQPVIVPPPVMPPTMPIITPPSRPITTPTMPGLNKDFDIRVSTTVDDNQLPLTTPDKSGNPSVDLQDKNWKKAVDIARQGKGHIKKADNDQSLDVRFTYLPSLITPLPKKDAVAKLTPKPAEAVLKANVVAPPPPAPVSAVDAAACAALDAYKKRQLEAIESDRQTLTALQDAISQLGLQKQLDFMTGAGGSLSMQAAGGSDAPAPALAPKN